MIWWLKISDDLASLLLEVYESTSREKVEEIVNKLGYFLDKDYEVPMDGVQKTTLYRLFVKNEELDEASELLQELKFVYGVFGDSKIEPYGGEEGLSPF